MTAFVRAKLKRNYAAHFLHGMFGMTGFRLVNAPTFVPAYLHLLSGSDVIVGLGLALQQLGGVVSGILGAPRSSTASMCCASSLVLGSLMRLQILGLALAGWVLSGQALLIAVLFFLFVLGLFSGPQNVVFQYLLAKVIPIQWRGRLQGLRNMMGGLVAAALAYWAGHTLIGNNVLGQWLFGDVSGRLRADEPGTSRAGPSDPRAGASDLAAAHAHRRAACASFRRCCAAIRTSSSS